MNTKKRALGKGLSALLDTSDLEAQAIYHIEHDLLAVGTIGKVPLDLIGSNPFQPREDFNEASLIELSASIREQGVIQPVTVRKTNDQKLQLISGERRCRAARLAGLETIPAYIITATDHSMLEMAIVENIQRDNLNPIEVALGYRQLVNGYQLTQEMLSERVGKSRASIANYMRLLNLPADIQIALRNEAVTMGHARALLGIEDPVTQLEVYHDILSEGLSVRDVEEIVKNLSLALTQPGDQEKKVAAAKAVRADLIQIQHELSNHYRCKIQLKSRATGKGSIVMHFSSEEELQRILGLLKK